MNPRQLWPGLLAVGLAIMAAGCASTGSKGAKFTDHFQSREATVKIPFEGEVAEVRVKVYNFPANVHANNGVAAFQTEQWDTALEEFKQAVAEKPKNGSFHFALGVAHEIRGNSAEAQQEYREANRLSGTEGMFDAQAGLKRLEARRK